jgi:WD40 repeat protein
MPIKLWSPHTGKCLKTFYGHGSWVWAIAFSPDSNLIASGSYDHTVKIWDVRSGECLQTLLGHPGCVLAIAFSPDGKTLFSSGYEKIVKQWDVECWDIATGKCRTTLRPARPDEGTIITEVKGLTEAEMSTLKALGAVEVNSSCSMPVNFR